MNGETQPDEAANCLVLLIYSISQFFMTLVSQFLLKLTIWSFALGMKFIGNKTDIISDLMKNILTEAGASDRSCFFSFKCCNALFFFPCCLGFCQIIEDGYVS